jgi:Mg/Co/Ni transporter MgtE
MLADQLITNNYPTVAPDDKIFLALQLMEDYDVLHIAVVEHDKYLGLISKDDLLDGDDNVAIKVLTSSILERSVKSGEHFLSALKLASQYSLSLVPVISNDQEFIGAIPQIDLL